METKKTILYKTEEIAKMFKVAPQSIRNYRKKGMPTEINSPIRYNYEKCLKWLQQRKRKEYKDWNRNEN